MVFREANQVFGKELIETILDYSGFRIKGLTIRRVYVNL